MMSVMWKRLLENYQPPPIDQAKVEEMAAYIAKRRVEIGEHGLI